MTVAGRTNAMPFPPLRSVLSGLRRNARLALASRFGDRRRLQRAEAERAVADLVRWCAPRADPIASLHAAERSQFSQHGEDGLIAALLERIDVRSRTFVEIGAADGRENCTRALAERGWRGFWFEADPRRAQTATAVAGDLDVTVRHALVRTDNVLALLADAAVPDEPDVFVIDIDSADFWVLRVALRDYRPRLVVAEYNAAFPPGKFWTRRNRADGSWDDTFRHGASLDALAWVASRAGYQLVACESSGANAFFVRDDLVDAADLDRLPLDALYRPLLIAPPAIGHPARVEPDCPRLTESELAQVRVSGARIIARRGSTPIVFGVLARIENATSHRLSSTGPTPLRLSAHVLDEEGRTARFDAERNWIHGGVPAHGSAWAGGVFRVDEATRAVLRLTLVQEGVGWLDAGAFDLAVG